MGLKGFLARHFGPVIYADLAEEGICQIGVVFMVPAALSGIIGVVAYANVRPAPRGFQAIPGRDAGVSKSGSGIPWRYRGAVGAPGGRRREYFRMS